MHRCATELGPKHVDVILAQISTELSHHVLLCTFRPPSTEPFPPKDTTYTGWITQSNGRTQEIATIQKERVMPSPKTTDFTVKFDSV